MTTNLGAHLIQQNLAELTAQNAQARIAQTQEEVLALLRKSVRPEFLNRIDETIVFEPLSKTTLKQVVEILLKQTQQDLLANNLQLEISDSLKQHLVQHGYNPQLGARPLKRLIQKTILNNLSKALLEGFINTSQPILATLDKQGRVQFVVNKQ